MAPKAKVASKGQDASEDMRLAASGFVTAMKAPSSSQEQKAALNHYQSLPRFDPLKKEILMKWKNDKTCNWYNTWKETHTKKVVQKDERTQGYGTVSLPLFGSPWYDQVTVTNIVPWVTHSIW